VSQFSHISKARLAEYRQQADPIADSVIEAYFPQDREALQKELEGLAINSSELSRDAKSELQRLYREVHSIHIGLDSDVLKKGQKFFGDHASDIMLLLGMLSLPYCYAAANGAEVLVRSRRILEEPEKRLLETAEFVFDVSAKDAFQDKGKAIVSIIKVRLMHAAARWYAKKSTDWEIDVYGEPVNQEDMAGTNLAFSLIVVRGLKKLGKSIHSEEAFHYINYWNAIGKLLGLKEDLLPRSNKEAYILERNIRERQFEPSESGKRLTQSLLTYFEEATYDSPLKGQSNALVAFLLGEKVSQILGVEQKFMDNLVFQPYKYLFQFQNILDLKNDSYSQALKQFREAQKSMS